MPSASLWASVPHYVAAAPNPKAALALVRKLERLVGVSVDASELESAAADYERQVSLAVQSDPDVRPSSSAWRPPPRRRSRQLRPQRSALGRRRWPASSSASCASAARARTDDAGRPRRARGAPGARRVRRGRGGGGRAPGPRGRRRRRPGRARGAAPDRRAAGLDHRRRRVLRPGGPRRSRRLRPALAERAARAPRRRAPAARRHGDRPLHRLGAIAATLAARRPGARVVASDVDARAVACAVANGVEAVTGDLFAPLPPELERRVDVVVGVVPYVPTPELGLLQRDTLAFESARSYDGGPDGTAVLRRALAEAPRFLRPGGALLLELGGEAGRRARRRPRPARLRRRGRARGRGRRRPRPRGDARAGLGRARRPQSPGPRWCS